MGHPETHPLRDSPQDGTYGGNSMGTAGTDAPRGLPHEGTLALASPAGRQLAAELRRIKQASGLSFARLEARTHYSKASLERYVNGKLFPGRDAVEDIAQACGADPGPLLEFWDDALNDALKAAMETREATPPPAPEPSTSGCRDYYAMGLEAHLLRLPEGQARCPHPQCRRRADGEPAGNP
ncbi:helix-turn-helix domain-containing protein [Streptomyces asiaticus]